MRINVTRSSMPSFEEYCEEIRDLWDSRWLTNHGQKHEALAAALVAGTIGGAGLDTLSPEPVAPDHPLAVLTGDAATRLVLSPHIGGVTEGSFRRAWTTIWSNISRVAAGETPVNVVS